MYFTVHNIQHNQLPFSCILLSYLNVQSEIMLSFTFWWCTRQNQILTWLSASGCAICKTFKGSSKYSWSFTSELSLSSSCSCHLNCAMCLAPYFMYPLCNMHSFIKNLKNSSVPHSEMLVWQMPSLIWSVVSCSCEASNW